MNKKKGAISFHYVQETVEVVMPSYKTFESSHLAGLGLEQIPNLTLFDGRDDSSQSPASETWLSDLKVRHW